MKGLTFKTRSGSRAGVTLASQARITRVIWGSLLFLVLCLPHVTLAQSEDSKQSIKLDHDNDVVVMENGDRNTGEIKKMEFGILYLKSDRVADTMELDWERVVQVESIARYEFETISREIYIGTVTKDSTIEPQSGYFRILLDNGSPIQLRIKEVLSIHEMGRSFLSRLNVSLDAGISFTSANSRTQTNFNFSGGYRRSKKSGNLTASSQFSGEPGTEKTARHELQLTTERYLRKKWDTFLLTAFLHDNQQELQLRSTAGGGIRRMFFESNRTQFYGIAGAVYTNENYFDQAQSDRNNAEALVALGISTYRFRGSSLNTSVWVFPSLSDPGRVRIDTAFNWKWDMVSDLYWKVSFTNNYDNRPPPNGIHNNLSINSTVGWSF